MSSGLVLDMLEAPSLGIDTGELLELNKLLNTDLFILDTLGEKGIDLRPVELIIQGCEKYIGIFTKHPEGAKFIHRLEMIKARASNRQSDIKARLAPVSRTSQPFFEDEAMINRLKSFAGQSIEL